MKKAFFSLLVSLFLFHIPSCVCEDLATSVFVDTYSAQSKDRHLGTEQPYLTQPSKDGDFHLNLGSLGASYDDSTYRLKLVGQFGDSVNANYNSEPKDSFKFLQEGFVGTYLTDDSHIDAGVFLSHIGAESWPTKDNINYTRSYIAEFSPYYESGIRIAHSFNKEISGQFLVLNGWQNISDNRHPALGTQLAYALNNTTITSNTFIGNESRGTRLFHDLVVDQKFEGRIHLLGSMDVGWQSTGTDSSGTWWGYSLMGCKQVLDWLMINGRFEYYSDPSEIIVSSVTEHPFKAYGASFGSDFYLGSKVTLRAEVRELFSSEPVFLDNAIPTKEDTLFVVSLSFFDEQKI